MKKHTTTASDQLGFTIVELMIATLVSSMILLVITVGIVHFTSDYYKGINSSNTQATTQNAIDVIERAIQFNASAPTPSSTTPGVFCAGSQEFVYSLGKQLTGATAVGNWGLYQFNKTTPNCDIPTSVPAGGTQLLGKNMRVAYVNLAQQGTTKVWNLELHVAYGDSDLLCRTSIASPNPGSCSSNAATYAPVTSVSGTDVICKSQTGSQYCSLSNLTAAIGQRINN